VPIVVGAVEGVQNRLYTAIAEDVFGAVDDQYLVDEPAGNHGITHALLNIFNNSLCEGKYHCIHLSLHASAAG
jgi:hypothetical protein